MHNQLPVPWTAAVFLAFGLASALQAQNQPATVPPNGATPATSWKRTLAGTPTQPLTKVAERNWSADDGAASVCLWQDDALAAFSHTIDDNCAMDIPWWVEIADKHHIKLTWFIVTADVDRTDGRRHLGGTWENWRKVYAQGHDVQSHTVDHMDKKTDLPAEKEYADSQKAIETNIPGDRCLTLAYPGGARPNDPVVAMKHYISGRGGVPAINVPGKTTFEQTRNTSAGIVLDPNNKQAIQTCLDPKSPNYRGWYCGLTHFVGNHENTKKMITDGLEFVTKTPGNFWVGRYRDIVLYSMERDTHQLQARTTGPGQYELTLTCQMDPAVYDVPLTVKVKVPDQAKAVSANQGDKTIDANLIENDGHKYALVGVIPNRGAAIVVAR